MIYIKKNQICNNTQPTITQINLYYLILNKIIKHIDMLSGAHYLLEEKIKNILDRSLIEEKMKIANIGYLIKI